MTQQQLNQKMQELAEMIQLADEAKEACEALKDELKEHMNETGIFEVLDTETGHKATFRETVSNRFDSTSFKKVHNSLYEAFCTQTKYRRFTFK